MSKPNARGSLIGLKSSFPAMPKVAPVAYTAEIEERILGTSGNTSVYTEKRKDDRKDVQMPVHTEVAVLAPAAAAVPLPVRRKEPTVLMNAKLPTSLHARLKRTAQFNDISMTDILIRAIEAELATGRYVSPPETWGSDLV